MDVCKQDSLAEPFYKRVCKVAKSINRENSGVVMRVFINIKLCSLWAISFLVSVGTFGDKQVHAQKFTPSLYAEAFTSYDNSSNDRKSETLAVTLSTLGVAVPAGASIVGSSPGLFLTGILIGPSVGSLYASDRWRFFRGILIRSAAGGVSMYGIELILDETLGRASFFGGESEEMNESRYRTGWVLLVAGGVGALISTFYDIAVSSVSSVEDYNADLQNESAFNIEPWVEPVTGSAGLSASISF